MSYWVDQIQWYGALHQYCAKRHEKVHKTNLKDSWNASNGNLNYMPQVTTLQRRILCFKIRELKLHAVNQRWENSTAACKVLPSGADLAAPLSSESDAKPQFMAPQNLCDGKYPDAMIINIWPLLDNTQDAMHCIAIYSGKGELIKQKSCNMMYILDEQLHPMELCIYHGINVEVEGFEGERISYMCWYTGSQSLRRGDRQNDWVWMKQHPRECCAVLNGCLPWQLQ